MKLKNPIREIRKAMTPPCTRCGKAYSHPFHTSYPREFWKDNKKRVGEVCEKCRDEVDDDNVRRRNAKKGVIS